MAHRDIIVIGASLGGFDALAQVVAGLPEDLPASVLIVQHIAPHARSYLIILTGQLDDGTAGLWAIKDRGGIAELKRMGDQVRQITQEAMFNRSGEAG